jgi:hypothetical protein
MELERHIQIRHKEKRRHVFADGPAVVDGDRTRTWAELYDRCARLGDALRKQGCGRGDVVQCMLDNTAEMVEAQHGVAMSGATLGSVNTRLDAATVAYVLEHSDARLFIADERYEATCREALATLENPPPLVVVGGRADGYEALVASGDAAAPWTQPEDEWDALALNYTSGTVWKSNLRRVRPESPRRPPHHRRDACSMAWRRRFLTAGRSQRLSGAPDTMVDFHTGRERRAGPRASSCTTGAPTSRPSRTRSTLGACLPTAARATSGRCPCSTVGARVGKNRGDGALSGVEVEAMTCWWG